MKHTMDDKTGFESDGPAQPYFSTKWEREDYERQKRGEPPLGPFRTEYGWVIERASSSPAEPEYYSLLLTTGPWSNLAQDALRFARKKDAEDFHECVCPEREVRICEHAWDSESQ